MCMCSRPTEFVISVARAISKPASFASLAMCLFTVIVCIACPGVFLLSIEFVLRIFSQEFIGLEGMFIYCACLRA